MKKAIVTGGAGLIGSGVCKTLVDQGWEVASFDLKAGEAGTRHILCDLSDEAAAKIIEEQLARGLKFEDKFSDENPELVSQLREIQRKVR